ncbi:MAG: Co2+/Mg2+ efflux protein ApaG [Alphaproteobacteria bacterium]|nr:Co2+/Mg2+ efflux protein ApaG [Alphaproteobacteria bacterium]
MTSDSTFTQTTNTIRVSVLPVYLQNQSNPPNNLFVWAYHICIENKGCETFQLLSRYWKITDAHGKIQEVQGTGVVGEQPVLHPGETFEYTSSVSLTLPSGVMGGCYEMQSPRGETIEVVIPLFSLDSPEAQRTVH